MRAAEKKKLGKKNEKKNAREQRTDALRVAKGVETLANRCAIVVSRVVVRVHVVFVPVRGGWEGFFGVDGIPSVFVLVVLFVGHDFVRGFSVY